MANKDKRGMPEGVTLCFITKSHLPSFPITLQFPHDVHFLLMIKNLQVQLIPIRRSRSKIWPFGYPDIAIKDLNETSLEKKRPILALAISMEHSAAI